MRAANRSIRNRFAVGVATVAVAAMAGVVWGGLLDPAFRVYHAPVRVARHVGAYTVNVTGVMSRWSSGGRYRLNDSAWHSLVHATPRVPKPKFTIELDPATVRPGENRLVLEARRWGLRALRDTILFNYDPVPVSLPMVQNWVGGQLEVQDGFWEVIEDGGERRVRPVPGQEDYDRIVVVTGAFAGGRRVETSLVYRGHIEGAPFGFGVLPLWGGRPDADAFLPRRGWNFSLAWFYSHYDGVGQEFSYKDTSDPPRWVSNYRDIRLIEGARYNIVVECWPEVDARGRHLRFYQRMKWWRDGEPRPKAWQELRDDQGAPLPPGEFCVALVSHRSQVEFGPVRVSALASRVDVPDSVETEIGFGGRR